MKLNWTGGCEKCIEQCIIQCKRGLASTTKACMAIKCSFTTMINKGVASKALSNNFNYRCLQKSQRFATICITGCVVIKGNALQ